MHTHKKKTPQKHRPQSEMGADQSRDHAHRPRVGTAPSCLLLVFISKWNLYTLANRQWSRADTCTSQLPWQSENRVALKTKASHQHQPPACIASFNSFFFLFQICFSLLSQHVSGGYSNSELITVQVCSLPIECTG